MLYIYICENDYNFFPVLHYNYLYLSSQLLKRSRFFVTLEYALHIVTWADFMLEITGFGRVMDELFFCFPTRTFGTWVGFPLLLSRSGLETRQRRSLKQSTRGIGSTTPYTRVRACVTVCWYPRAYQRGEGRLTSLDS